MIYCEWCCAVSIFKEHMDNMSREKRTFAELRKTYPRLGLKWDSEEDARLRQAYQQFRTSGSTDFDALLSALVAEFGRAPGGIQARLAMHFSDVPGWDYALQAQREQARASQVAKRFSTQQDELLLREYQAYMARGTETYTRFLRRLSSNSGIAGAHITERLKQLVGDVEKVQKTKVHKRTTARDRDEEDSAPINFSGNKESEEALRLLNDTHENVFITGEAGTGKSTLLQYFRRTTKKNVVVLAPTGVAALNVQGQTIHSFCGFGPDITVAKVKKLPQFNPKKKLLANVETIIIDEISMVRADLLDCVDAFLRANGHSQHAPFGGYQMVFIGDLFQLPPVDKDFQSQGALVQEYASPYFFDSHIFTATAFRYIRLRTMYRQQDQVFLELLGAVRNNVVTEDHLRIINNRAHTEDHSFTFEQFAIYVTTTNHRARHINNFFLEKLSAPPLVFAGQAAGTFENKELPTDMQLTIKVGAQVMMLNNDRQKRWVNGTMGKVVGVGGSKDDHDDDRLSSMAAESSREQYYEPDSYQSVVSYSDSRDIRLPAAGRESRPRSISGTVHATSSNTKTVIIELETGETVYVEPYTWELFKFVLDKETRTVESETTGTYTQYPFKLAWAVTIHKAQGKTFNKVYIDLATGTFAHGQLYVALSRCRTLEGVYLQRAITPRDIILDPRVVEFMKRIQ